MLVDRPPDELSPAPLDTHVVGSRIAIHGSVSSTNDLAFNAGGDGTVIIADAQTAGRGRLGRVWHSGPGLGLWFSVALERQPACVTMAAALAVRDALAPHCALTVKWPNDLLLNGKKVCGILTEHRNGLTVVGVGLNVHHAAEDFPPALREQATSVARETGLEVTRSKLLRAILTRLDHYLLQIRSGDREALRYAWAHACDLLERPVRIGDVAGTVVGFEDDGSLLIAAENEMHRVSSGELKLESE